MKKISVIIILSVLGCETQSTDVELINNFIEEIILNKNAATKELETFIDFGKEVSKKKKDVYNIFIDENIKYLRKELNNSKHSITSNKNIKSLDINFIYNTNELDKVYHLVSNDKTLTTFIIRKDKIISFFYNIVKGNNKKRTPFMLNK